MRSGGGTVRTLMWRMGIEALYRHPRTSIPAREGGDLPVLAQRALRLSGRTRCGRATSRILPMAHGFMYLMAILDVASRKVLAFRLSNTLTADFLRRGA